MFKEKHAIQIVDSIERLQEGNLHQMKIKIEYLSLDYEDKLSRARKILDILNKDNGLKLIVKREEQNELKFFYGLSDFLEFNYVIKNSKNEVICYFYVDPRVLFSNDYKDGDQINEVEYGIGCIEPVLLDKKFGLPQIIIFNNQYQNLDIELAYRSLQVIEEFSNRFNLTRFRRNIKRMTSNDLKRIHPNEIFVYECDYSGIQTPIELLSGNNKDKFFFNNHAGYFKSLNIHNSDDMTKYLKYIEHIKYELEAKAKVLKQEVITSIFFIEGIPYGNSLLNLNNHFSNYSNYIPQINLKFIENDKEMCFRLRINYEDVGKDLGCLPLSVHHKNFDYLEELFGESITFSKCVENKEYYFGVLSTLYY